MDYSNDKVFFLLIVPELFFTFAFCKKEIRYVNQNHDKGKIQARL